MKKVILGLIGVTMLTACGDEPKIDEEHPVVEAIPIQMEDVKGSPDFADAKISVGSVTATPDGDKVKVNFSFDVANYELKNQTENTGGAVCANSDKGQHIHFILDNQPYAALYEPKHEVTLEKNSEHYLLVFLSRSYHESIKTEGASAMYHFKIDEKGKVVELDAPTTPMIFYSRPKGNYVGAKNTENLLFDYFLWNTSIGKDANHVLAHINGKGVDTTMVVTTWSATFLKNMPMGKNTITLTLTDENGNAIEGPMTNVSREFTLAEAEPLPAE